MEVKNKTVADYKRDIVRVLKKANTYSSGVDAQVQALATAMRTLDMANRDIDGLESTTVLEQTRYGSKLAPHPVFKVQKDAQDSITRQMKILGLTTELLAGGDECDPLVELTKAVGKAGRRPVIVKPE